MPTDADYGTDVRMFVGGNGPPDIDPYFTEIDGAEAVAQAISLRCYTPRAPNPGSLIGADNDGIFLPDFMQGKIDQQTLGIIKKLVQAECRKDERVGRVQVDVTYESSTKRLLVEISGVTSDRIPFDLTLAVSDMTVELLNQD